MRGNRLIDMSADPFVFAGANQELDGRFKLDQPHDRENPLALAMGRKAGI